MQGASDGASQPAASQSQHGTNAGQGSDAQAAASAASMQLAQPSRGAVDTEAIGTASGDKQPASQGELELYLSLDCINAKPSAADLTKLACHRAMSMMCICAEAVSTVGGELREPEEHRSR